MVTIKVEADPEYDLVSKVGSIDLEYGVKGQELMNELAKAQATFVKSMELRGLILATVQDNPKWITDGDGRLNASYAIDWQGERVKQTPVTGGGMVDLPNTRETTLEETEGMVEYRIVGVFWGPKTAVEILKHVDEIRDKERLRRKPTSFGAGGIQLPGTPNYPGDEALGPERPRADPRTLKALERRHTKNARPNTARPGDRARVDDADRRLV